MSDLVRHLSIEGVNNKDDMRYQVNFAPDPPRAFSDSEIVFLFFNELLRRHDYLNLDNFNELQVNIDFTDGIGTSRTIESTDDIKHEYFATPAGSALQVRLDRLREQTRIVEEAEQRVVQTSELEPDKPSNSFEITPYCRHCQSSADTGVMTFVDGAIVEDDQVFNVAVSNVQPRCSCGHYYSHLDVSYDYTDRTTGHKRLSVGQEAMRLEAAQAETELEQQDSRTVRCFHCSNVIPASSGRCPTCGTIINDSWWQSDSEVEEYYRNKFEKVKEAKIDFNIDAWRKNLKAGDKVRVKSWDEIKKVAMLSNGEQHISPLSTSRCSLAQFAKEVMAKCGQIVVIYQKDFNGAVRLTKNSDSGGNRFHWADPLWLEPVDIPEIKQSKVKRRIKLRGKKKNSS